MAWQESKTDWDGEDYLNYWDLNRIENNTAEVAALEKELLSEDAGLDSLVTDRDYNSIEFADGYSRIESNIKKVSDIFPLNGMIPPKTVWNAEDSISYIDLNRMEANITLLYNLLKPNADALQLCGDFNCGEEVI